ncbi:hypothetical protein DYB28_007789 [Aphanomyces astaci]|uniref:Vesicle transport v-SNARE N-terminal domain-containing protein n=2 Tax=Aphanomyces astaci TaxID=112090 RepID=A0A397DMH7_APHAT|nr:hypothetical protein DYB25_007771 [Aphanomyces astaci]RHY57694.1 hypothetical protein DYB38_007167 [Aphanomyces astaci]RHY60435.1 hypothetical protein DYB34_011154 [Aphanomyces astaci]RHY64247.1 hypothetical protein DYB30_008958 [Aphanomyces astaci]RHZ03513.1 hypothetical protein DYB31_002110 [Aphanomyces astaci]
MEGGAGGELSERFQSLEEDYIDCKRTINNSIHDLSSSDQRHVASQMAQANIVEAQRCMKLMSVELRGKVPAMRKAMQAKQSKRIVQETEHIGISVMDTLAQQRETLLSAHDKVKDTRETAGDARRVLQRMSQRVLTHKLTLWFVIVVLVVAIALVFYHNFIRRT